MQRCHAWINHDKAKAKKAISVPLNSNAIAVLKSCRGINAEYVFTYQGNPVGKCNTRAWSNALRRAGLKIFDGMTYATLGLAGMYRMVQACKSFKC